MHCKRSAYDLYIGRPSKWGNPFALPKGASDLDRHELLALYRRWLMQQDELLADLHELRGKVLGCWCSPKACHGDVLAEIVNKET